MIDPDRRMRAAATALVVGLLLAGCGDRTPAGPATSAPTGSSLLPSTSTGMPNQKVVLPWPAAGAADAAALQAAADNGSQPWLLDPSEVALSYAEAAHGWTHAEAYPGPNGTAVDVRDADGNQLTLTLAQPARVGSTGIWVVTDEQPS